MSMMEIKCYISEKRLFGDFEEIKLFIDSKYNIKEIRKQIEKVLKKQIKQSLEVKE